MIKIGCHLSSSKGFLAMGMEAVKIGANTFQFFTRNPRGSRAKPLDSTDINEYLQYSREHGLFPPLAHAPYTMNPCALSEDLRLFTARTMAEDIERLELIPGSMYNFHPGSHVKQGVESGIGFIAETLNKIIKPQQQTLVLLETMAGKGTEIGRSFDELAAIIYRVESRGKMGVCLDTCHVFDGGYDIADSLDFVLEEFHRIVGIDRLKAVHLNDSMNPIGSHKDRHEKIGMGGIGLNAFEKIISHPSLKLLPFYLETPNDVSGYRDEISMLKEKYKGTVRD